MASHSIELQPTAQWIPNRISQSSLEPMTHTVSQLGSVGERTKPTEYAGGTDGSEPSDESRGPIYQEELPPADGGRAAWVYLFVAFMIEALCWGWLSRPAQYSSSDHDSCRILFLLWCFPVVLFVPPIFPRQLVDCSGWNFLQRMLSLDRRIHAIHNWFFF